MATAYHLCTVMGLALIIQYLGVVNSEMAPLTKLSGKDITGEVFGNTDRRTHVFPAAYGDFNSDKLTDMVTVSHAMSTIIIYLGYEEPPLLRKAISCHINTTNQGIVRIVGVSLGDFTGDGLMDVLVSFIDVGNENVTRVLVFPGNGTDLMCSTPESGKLETIDMVQEPLILDLNGDMIMDLLGEKWVPDNENGSKTSKEERTVWIFEHSVDNPKYQSYKFEIEGNKTAALRPMVNSSSNAFVDVDGDMVPEIVIMTHDKPPKGNNGSKPYFIEHYGIQGDFQNGVLIKVSFILKAAILLDKTNTTQVYGQPIFMDLNQNGKLFHLIPFCKSSKCSKGDQGLLAISDGIVNILLLSFKEKLSFFHEHRDLGWDGHYARTITLRAGDYNLDGYPDLIGVLEDRSHRKPNFYDTQAVIFENVPCLPDANDKPCNVSRTFRINYDVLQQYGQVVLATFYDIFEDGLIDVMLVRRANNLTRSEEKFEVRAFQNSPDYDANFMKVMVLSGNKCLKCPKTEIPYGNILPGPVISYKTTTQAGHSQVAIAAQFYRSSHMTMDLPCTIFGIGHSPNFVETLHVNIGYSAIHLNASHVWTQIIPNSQIIVVPAPLDKPKQWKAKLFLTPSKAVLNTFGVLVGFCLFVTSLVLALQYKERREDRKDKLNEARQFHMM